MISIPRTLPSLADPAGIQVGTLILGQQLTTVAFAQAHLWGWRCRRAAHAEADWAMVGGVPSTYVQPKVSDALQLVWRSHPRASYVMVIARLAMDDNPATVTPRLYSAPMPAIGSAPAWALIDTGPAWSTAAGHMVPDVAVAGASAANAFLAYAPVVISTGETPRAGGTEPRPLDASAANPGDLLRLVLTPTDCRLMGADAIELYEGQVNP